MSNDTPRGFFKFIIGMDCETTGLSKGDHPELNHQAIAWGIVIADAKTLEPVEKLYLEIKWNEDSKKQRELDPQFGKVAETIHGLTFEYLEEHGVDEEEAAVQIAELIIKYCGASHIRTLGHNVHLFDLPFLKKTLRTHGIEFDFGNRHVDVFSAGFAALHIFNSDQLFDMMGFEHRGKHNALDDALMALRSAKMIRKICDKGLQ